MRAVRFGQDGWLVDWERSLARTDANLARRVAAALGRTFPNAEVVTGGASVLVRDLSATDGDAIVRSASEPFVPAGRAPLGRVARWSAPPEAEGRGRRETVETLEVGGEVHTIEIVYDGPDLDAIAAATGSTRSAIIEAHAKTSYSVEVVGFLPGFGYLAELDERLRLPRLASPRKVVPRGSVGIAGRYTGIYPFASPGGWNLLGRAVDANLFDPKVDRFTRFRVGDTVRFLPTEPAATSPSDLLSAPSSAASAEAHLEILSCAFHATIQDLGRRLASQGIPRSGPLDEQAHRAANRALGNRDTAATIELPLDGLEVLVRRPIHVSVDGEEPMHLAKGAIFRVERNARAVRYLAVRGGFDVPEILGSRATLLVAGLGGLEGRRLRRGDRLRVGDDALDTPSKRYAAVDLELQSVQRVEILPGPHAGRFSSTALDELCRVERTVSAWSDRIGTRFDGPRIERHDGDAGVPEPMMPGAVQIATDGTPIVLGPDSAVTGGYPVLAVLTAGGRSRLARVRPGGRAHFSLA